MEGRTGVLESEGGRIRNPGINRSEQTGGINTRGMEWSIGRVGADLRAEFLVEEILAESLAGGLQLRDVLADLLDGLHLLLQVLALQEVAELKKKE